MPAVTPALKVLDLGCGDGLVGVALAATGRALQVRGHCNGCKGLVGVALAVTGRALQVSSNDAVTAVTSVTAWSVSHSLLLAAHYR